MFRRLSIIGWKDTAVHRKQIRLAGLETVKSQTYGTCGCPRTLPGALLATLPSTAREACLVSLCEYADKSMYLNVPLLVKLWILSSTARRLFHISHSQGHTRLFLITPLLAKSVSECFLAPLIECCWPSKCGIVFFFKMGKSGTTSIDSKVGV